jgi:hypothetical protein
MEQNNEPKGKDDIVKIVLFVITGAILAFFGAMVIIGVFRAYRHPERYIPPTLPGQPRPNRAKGITRAILDTIPIISLSDDGRSPPSSDAQLQPIGHVNTESTGGVGPSLTTSRVVEGKYVATKSKTAESSDEEKALWCSICTDEFKVGEQVRLLPCNHRFHPSCIDPWLLNMNSTCPLCRIDLGSEEGKTGV